MHQLGFVFFGWGVLLACGAVFVAPRLMARWSPVPLLGIVMALVTVDLLVIGLGIHSKTTMVVAIILSGILLGTGNALMSTMLMRVTHAMPAIGASATNLVGAVTTRSNTPPERPRLKRSRLSGQRLRP